MKTTLLFLIPAALFGATPYQIWDPNSTANWSVNGAAFNSSVGGSQISTLAYS